MTTEPRSKLTHHEWMGIAAEEYRRLTALLETLTATQWEAATDCDGWTVRDIVAHLTGAAEATARIREQLRQQRLGRKRKGDGVQLDAVNELQIEERSGLSTSELLEQFTGATARGLRARGRTPAPVRALRIPFPPPVGWASLGYLTDIVYTRDAWMHRVDICRAIGTPVAFTDDHDALLIADAARAWQHVSGAQGCVLTTPSGETLPIGSDLPAAAPTYDAIDFARALSGRGQLPGISSQMVLF